MKLREAKTYSIVKLLPGSEVKSGSTTYKTRLPLVVGVDEPKEDCPRGMIAVVSTSGETGFVSKEAEIEVLMPPFEGMLRNLQHF